MAQHGEWIPHYQRLTRQYQLLNQQRWWLTTLQGQLLSKQQQLLAQ
jgi:hypothetical protein